MNSKADPLIPGSPETSTRKDSATNVPVRAVSDKVLMFTKPKSQCIFRVAEQAAEHEDLRAYASSP
jgi:hypothetical protein